MRTRRVSGWRDAKMVKRWAASAFLATEKNFRKIMGYRDLCEFASLALDPVKEIGQTCGWTSS